MADFRARGRVARGDETALRIAIATDWFAPRRGGMEQQLGELAERLAARGHVVDVITSVPGAVDGQSFRVRALDVMTIPRLQLAVSPRLFRALHRELARGYDVVHAHVSVVSPVGYAAAIVARLLGLPVVITFHSVLRSKRYLLRAANLLGGLSESAVVWTAVSDLVAEQIREALDGADVAALRNGVDLAFWRTNSFDRPAEDRAVTLVSTMRLRRKKRPLELLRAFAGAAERVRANVKLLIVGDGPERAALERAIADFRLDNGRARAALLGWLDRDKLRELYRTSDAFALSSTRESFGIAALEARAAGLPVVAMRASGSSEFLAHHANALLCADDADLSRSMERLIDEAELRTKLAHGPESLERYDWRVVLAEHEAVYRSAMQRATSAAAAVATSS